MSIRKKLQDKFAKFFIVPLTLSILFSVIINLTCVFLFIRNFPNNSSLKAIVSSRDEETTKPLISRAISLIKEDSKIQLNSLELLLKYYNKYSKLFTTQDIDQNSLIYFISKYSLNAMDDCTENCQIKGLWFTSPEIKDLTTSNQVTADFIKKLYTLVNMNLLIKGLVDTNKLLFNNLQFIIPDSDIVYFFPYDTFKGTNEIFNHGNTKTNYPKWCIKEDLTTPDYYYYKCENVYINTMNNEDEYTLLPPHIHYNGESYQTTCIKGENIIICINAIWKNVIKALNEINSLLSGYFYILKSNSETPLYYPKSISEYSTDIYHYEFGSNSNFYIDEITLCKNVTRELLQDPNNISKKTYIKYGIETSMTKYAIKILDNKKEITVANLFYILKGDTYKEKMLSFQSNLVSHLMFQIVFFIILGTILALISKYLINAISKHIVIPIKKVTQTLQGLSQSPMMMYSKYQNNQNPKDEDDEENTNLDNLSKANDDEDIPQIEHMPKEINDLLQKLISLKKLIKNTVINYDNQNMMSVIFAKEQFRKSDNSSGVLFCDSNIGNLSLVAKKYDKAIYHLTISINEASSNNRREIVESRYPKLLYAFRKYFDTIQKIKKNNEIYYKDYFSLSNCHSLDCYKKAIDSYANMLSYSTTKEERKKFYEAQLEQLRFLIKFELPNSENKKKTFFEITELINSLRQDVNELIKSVEINDEYIKNIVDLMRTNKKNILESIDTPYYVLNQKLNYLIGKFCFACGKYSKSIIYFSKAKTNRPYQILDAMIVRKSLKMIIKVINKVSKNNALLTMHLNVLQEELNELNASPRDVAVVILTDSAWYTESNLAQLVARSKMSAMNAYDNLITSNDTYGLFLYINELRIEVGMTAKTKGDNDYIREVIENCFTSESIKLANEDKKNVDVDIEKVVKDVFDVMKRKFSQDKYREKWVIVVVRDVFCAEAENVFKSRENGEKVAFVRVSSKKNDSLSKLRKKGIINSNHMEELKKLMKINGKVDNIKTYQNERYEKFDQYVKSGTDL